MGVYLYICVYRVGGCVLICMCLYVSIHIHRARAKTVRALHTREHIKKGGVKLLLLHTQGSGEDGSRTTHKRTH